jgi:hypothetical protein
MAPKNKLMKKGMLSIAIADTDNDGVKETDDDDLEKDTENVEDQAGEISPSKKKEDDEEDQDGSHDSKEIEDKDEKPKKKELKFGKGA